MDTRCNRGFSIIELLVVVSIFAFIAVIGIASYNRGSSQTLLTSLAYDIALSVRQAQAFGLSVRESTAGGFDIGYGIHFDKSDTGSYIFFVDIDGNEKYMGGSSCSTDNECLDRFILGRGHKISDMCVTGGSQDSCLSSGLSSIDIIFLRPDPDAIVHKDGIKDDYYGGANITVSSSGGALTRRVIISSAGQISVTP